MRDTAIVMYTHTDYSDAWPLFFGQFDELFPFKNCPQYVFLDANLGTKEKEIPPNWTVITYDEELPYSGRVASCLEKIDQKYVIFHHEDMPLYLKPNSDLLKLLPSLLEDTGKPFLKFVRAIEEIEPYDRQGIHRILPSSFWFFSIQPGFWRTDTLLDVYTNSGGMNIWEFEVHAQRHCKSEDIHGLVWYDNEPKRGMHHFDSSLYPYIATAIHKGKWVTNEYPELLTLLAKYNIDPSIRGEHGTD